VPGELRLQGRHISEVTVRRILRTRRHRPATSGRRFCMRGLSRTAWTRRFLFLVGDVVCTCRCFHVWIV
jgi:hypothetical protein